MADPATETGQPKRKHVTTACVACRESKVKCDADVPSCSNCRNKGKQCQYPMGDDKRKLSLRFALELSMKRNAQLCDFIVDSGLRVPDMDPESDAAMTKTMAGLRLAHLLPEKRAVTSPGPVSVNGPLAEPNPQPQVENAALYPHPNLPGGFDGSQRLPTPSQNLGLHGENDSATNNLFPAPMNTDLLMDANSPLSNQLNQVLSDWIWNPLENMTSMPYSHTTDMDSFNASNLSAMDGIGLPQSDPGSSPDSQINNHADSPDTAKLIGQLSDRIGSLQIDPSGQVRFYGPTSNFNLVDMPAPDNLTVHRTLRGDGQDYLDRLGIGAMVPPELEEHLANLYFAWQDPAIHVVNRSIYEEAKDKWKDEGDTPYFSLTLMNAICALGAAFEPRYHPTFITFPRSLSDFFADRAKALLDIELDCPCVATVQAMIVLSGHDIGCKRDARGWLYSGMALRLAFDLSLHIELSTFVAHGCLSHEEAALRQDVFWGAYTTDRIWSYYLGRPSHTSIVGMMVPRPGANPGYLADGQWIPYTSPQSLDDCSPVIGYVSSTAVKRALLWEIIAPLSEALYASLGVITTDLGEMYRKVTADLIKWKDDLDVSLQINTAEHSRPYLPHVILLHMQYHQIIIYSQRPWMRSSNTHVDPFLADARGQCIKSAVIIAELLKIYESRYTLRRINVQAVGITCSAALLLIFGIVTKYTLPDGKDLKPYLSICFRAMEEFSSAWENAKRNRDFLILLRRKWETRSRVAGTNRRMSSLRSPVDFTGRKRARTSSNGSDARPGTNGQGSMLQKV
ncbi:fungal-specific transcription factor domain-containing protein [Xylariaceae sp. FL1019]|nr:fungal-specific transcription factor domain-containing protein [Xylariaceae sp. FL1019]